jgi:hypothetical protein
MWGGNKYIEYIDRDTTQNAPITIKQADNELQKIMEEANFKAVTLLRARKVVSDNKMKAENLKHEDIVKQENTRHDAILAQIEAENEAIRKEELSLVGKVNFQ